MRVLVVDDEPRLADAVRRSLVEQGVVVDVAHDGLLGHQMATSQHYDVLILDLLLPMLNGYALCRRLRAEGVVTPVLVLTAKDGEYDEADALDLGADDYLRKPFATVVLLARVFALARRGSRGRTATLQVGGLVLHEGRRTVTCREQALELTPREFALLHELMREPDRTHSRRELLDRVWGSDGWGRGTNVVDVYVGYLRRKLDACAGGASLQTVRGQGYRLAGLDSAEP